MACGDKSWSSATFLSSRDNQVRWHAETNMVIYPLLSKTQCLLIETIKVSPPSSRDNQVRWNVETIMVIHTLFAIHRQASSMACGDHYGHPFSLFSRLFLSPLPSRDNRFRWHTETICPHLHFEDDNVFSHCMPSKGDNVIIYISKTTMSSQGDKTFFYISKTRMSSPGDNAFFYFLKTTMSLVITCLQKATMSSFAFQRW